MDKLDLAALPMNPSEDEGPQISLVEMLTWLGESKRLIAGVTLVAAVVGVAAAFLLPKSFTATTTLLPPAGQQQGNSSAALAALGNLGALAPAGLAPKTPDELYVNLLKSDSVTRALATKFDLYKRYDANSHFILRKVFPTYVHVSADKKSGVVTVEVNDRDPKFAADLANAHLIEITKLMDRLAVSEAKQRRLFFEQQLKETKDKLITAEQTLKAVQEKSGMIVLDKQAEEIIRSVAKLRTRISEREVSLRLLQSATTSENPDVRLLVLELAALRKELAQMESVATAADAATPVTKQASGVAIDIPVGKLPAAAVDYTRAAREVKFQEAMLTSLLRQFETAKLDEAKDGTGLQQVDVAMPPDRHSTPKRSLVMAGITLLGLIGSSLFVVWRRYRARVRQQDPNQNQAMSRLSQAWRLRRADTPSS